MGTVAHVLLNSDDLSKEGNVRRAWLPRYKQYFDVSLSETMYCLCTLTSHTLYPYQRYMFDLITLASYLRPRACFSAK